MNIKEQLQLLQIEDVTTERQKKNGTITLKLPIKSMVSLLKWHHLSQVM